MAKGKKKPAGRSPLGMVKRGVVQAGKNAKERIEPLFDIPDGPSASDFSVTSEDRAAAPSKKSVKSSASRGTTRKPAGAAGQPKSSRPKSPKPKRASAKLGQKKAGQTKAARKPVTRKKKKQSLLARIGYGFKKTIYWGLVAGIWATVIVGAVVAYYAVQLPQTSTWAVPERPPNVRIVSVNGKVLANRGTTGGEDIRLEQMSPYIPQAVIAIEDRRYYSHFGVDPIGIAGAMIKNIRAGRIRAGGSTITQQLAKNLFLKPERTFKRKVQELVLAFWLETKFTKNEIIEIYLNRVYFGASAYGVDAAARRYYNKSARDVNLAQAATLAGLLKAPSALSPASNPKGAEVRAQVVLGAMRRANFITDKEAATALTMPATKAKSIWSGSEHYIADWVMQDLKLILGDVKEDILIDTTIDLDLQTDAESLIREGVQKAKSRNVSQAALVSVDGTGAVRAMVGGADYSASQFNRAKDAKRQPGSAFKPIVYLASIEQGRTPSSIRNDAPIRIGKWKPENYKNEYLGRITLAEALAKSVNTVAAQLLMEVGPKTVIETAKRLGIRSKLKANPSLSLGTSEVSLLELTDAYVPFSNGGYRVSPWLIRRITTPEGEVLYERKSQASPKVIDNRALGMMNAMLRGVVENGTGKAARIEGWQVAGKTGTSQSFRDAWFIGYTANLVTGVWLGNDDGKPMKKMTGGSIPAQIFRAFMKGAHEGVPVAELPGTAGAVATVIEQNATQSGSRPVVVPRKRPPRAVGEEQTNKRRTFLDVLFGRNKQ